MTLLDAGKDLQALTHCETERTDIRSEVHICEQPLWQRACEWTCDAESATLDAHGAGASAHGWGARVWRRRVWHGRALLANHLMARLPAPAHSFESRGGEKKELPESNQNQTRENFVRNKLASSV